MELLLVLLGLLLLSLTLWDVFETIVVPRPTPGWFRIGRYLVRSILACRPCARRPGTEPEPGRGADPRSLRPGRDDLAPRRLARRPVRRIRADPVRAPRPARSAASEHRDRHLLRGELGPDDRLRRHRRDRDAGPDRRRRGGRLRARDRGARGHVPVLALRVVPAPRGPRRAPPGEGRRHRCRPSSSSRTSPGSSCPTTCRSSSASGSAGSSRCSTRTSPTRCWATSGRATTTCRGSARSGRSSIRRPSSSPRSTVFRAARRSWPRRSATISSRTSRTSATGRRPPRPSTGPSFDAVYERLAAAGYRLVPEDEAWPAFAAARASYADRLEQMAVFWVAPSVSWFGGSEALRSPTHRPAGDEAESPAPAPWAPRRGPRPGREDRRDRRGRRALAQEGGRQEPQRPERDEAERDPRTRSPGRGAART